MKLAYVFLFFFEFVFAKESAIRFENSWTLASDFKVGSYKVGGLSGCVKKKNKIYFISDDHGGFGGGRIISFDWDSTKKTIQFSSGQNIKIQHGNPKKVLDLEGIAINSAGKFLISNEGDQNKKPRQAPEIFWSNLNGQKLQSVNLPNEFLPNISGQQTKGVQNNLAFEGLSSDLLLNKWGAFLEAPVVKSKDQNADHLSYIESDLDSLNVEQNLTYPIPRFEGSSIASLAGVTDFLFVSEQQLLVLERGAELSMQGLQYHAQLCFAEKDKHELKRKCTYSFNEDLQLIKSTQQIANYEGLCWLNEKKTQFMVVSDNNFSKTENTVFLLYNLN